MLVRQAGRAKEIPPKMEKNDLRKNTRNDPSSPFFLKLCLSVTSSSFKPVKESNILYAFCTYCYYYISTYGEEEEKNSFLTILGFLLQLLYLPITITIFRILLHF